MKVLINITMPTHLYIGLLSLLSSEKVFMHATKLKCWILMEDDIATHTLEIAEWLNWQVK